MKDYESECRELQENLESRMENEKLEQAEFIETLKNQIYEEHIAEI